MQTDTRKRQGKAAQIGDILEQMSYGPAPEDAAIAGQWLEAHASGFGHFIDGRFTPPGDLFAVNNPATGARLARVTQGSDEDVDRAIGAARAAQPRWAGLDGYGRARHLYALARHIQQHARFLAVLETLDNGKPIRESRDIDIPLVVRHFYHHAGWACLVEEEFAGHRPHGVCGQIIPWNFPLLMLAWKVAPALAAGNTVVLKPAQYTPLTALALAGIARQAGLPDGVLNIITGDGRTGAALVAHRGIDKIAFTGSTDVGREIRRRSAGTHTPLTLELGGKSPFVVCADADLDAAVEGVVDSVWFNQGEVCCAGSRIIASAAIAPQLEDLLRRRINTLRVGDPLDKSTDIGAIADPRQLARISRLMEAGKAEGVRLYQGRAPEGCFFPPTLACNVEPVSVLAREEIFGPVVTFTTFRTPDEALALANHTRYGLAASIWSENINLALDLASKVRAGVVWINCANIFDAGAGFGGCRESGFGREGGREGMCAYLTVPQRGARRPEETPAAPHAVPGNAMPAIAANGEIDRTAKLYVGGRQLRPDSGYSHGIIGARGRRIGFAGLGNRKDIRNAVEAAAGQTGWGCKSGHERAQILYFLAENLSARRAGFEERLRQFGLSAARAGAELEASLRRIFWYAAMADKFDGAVHSTKAAHMNWALFEPMGIMGIACPTRHPLLGFVSLIAPAIATGNRVVVVPSQTHPLAATDFYQLLDTSDMPGGVVNIITGERDALSHTLAGHEAVDAMWYFGTEEGCKMVETASADNLKRTWVEDGNARNWAGASGQGRFFLEQATQIKNIWAPFGE